MFHQNSVRVGAVGIADRRDQLYLEKPAEGPSAAAGRPLAVFLEPLVDRLSNGSPIIARGNAEVAAGARGRVVSVSRRVGGGGWTLSASLVLDSGFEPTLTW